MYYIIKSLGYGHLHQYIIETLYVYGKQKPSCQDLRIHTYKQTQG